MCRFVVTQPAPKQATRSGLIARGQYADPVAPVVLHVLPHPGEGGERYVEMLEAAPGYEFRRFHLSEGRRPLEALGRVPAARRAARDADLVHLHGDAVAVLCSSLMRGLPGVVTFNGLHLLRRLGGARRALFSRALRAAIARSATSICVAESELRDAEAVAGERLRSRLELIHNGVPLPAEADSAERSRAREEFGLGEDDVAVLFAAQLERRKGVLDLLDALAAARGAGAPLAGLICGDGPLRDEVERRAPDAGARALGFRTDLPRIQAASDIAVMPSEREGLSLAVLEAMGRGLALVVSDGAGNPDAVGDAGVIVPYGDSGALAEALSRLAADAGERERLGRAARERVASQFDPGAMVDRTAAVYERALAAA